MRVQSSFLDKSHKLEDNQMFMSRKMIKLWHINKMEIYLATDAHNNNILRSMMLSIILLK